MTDTTTDAPSSDTDVHPGEGSEVAVVIPLAQRGGRDEVIIVVDGDPVAPLDHRLRARRVEVRRAARRHRRRVWGSVAVVVGMCAALAVVAVSPLLDVDRVEVTGLSRVPVGEVHDATRTVRGRGLALVDLDDVRSRVEALPWVSRARVERRWPDHLVVRVTERAAVAVVVSDDGRRSLVLTGGRVPRQPPSSADDRLPVIALVGDVEVAGGRPLPPAVGAAVEMVAGLPASVKRLARTASVDSAGNAVVALAPTGSLVLGTAERVQEKFDSAETMLSGAVQLSCLERLDLRIPTAPTLLRAPGCR